MAVEFELNGEVVRTIDPGESLLDALRERCGLTSLKDGCAPQGQCGACLAHRRRRAQGRHLRDARRGRGGKKVVTLEGLSEHERELTARAFVTAHGLQCGFCIPGIALRAKHLLDKNPSPTRAEIAKAIDVHLCRCTGYAKISTRSSCSPSCGAAKTGRRPSPTAAWASPTRATAGTSSRSASARTSPT